MVIVVPGVTDIKDGPYKGASTVGATKVYMGGQQVGLLSGFRLSLSSDSPIPEVHFDFAGSLKEEDVPKMSDHLKASFRKYVDLVRSKLPWATWKSPESSSPVQPINVLDLGQISPTTPKSKDSG